MPASNSPRRKAASPLRSLVQLWAIYLISFVVFVSTSFAGEETFSNFNFAVTIPDGWVVMTNMLSQKDVRAAYCQPDKKRMLLFLVDTGHSPFLKLNSSFMTGYERGVKRSGGADPISTKTVDFAGVKAYERYSEKPSNGKNIANLTRVMVADGNVYIIECLKLSGNASEDDVLRGALDSFHFIKPPVENSMAFRMGYMVGFGLAFIALLGGVLAIIFHSRKKTDEYRRASGVPPALPPRR